jgi:sortase A
MSLTRPPRRIGLFVFILLAVLALVGIGVFFYSNTSQKTPSEEASKETTTAETTTKEEEAVAPSDPTLYLTVPKLGLYDNVVRNDVSDYSLSVGAGKITDTGFPWEKGDVNTYIACHRIGFPDTESYHQCLNLHQLQKGDEVTVKDANGRAYNYQVSESLQVGPTDLWAADPVEGRKMVSLQTCIENYNDFDTLGPDWNVRYIVRADQVS